MRNKYTQNALFYLCLILCSFNSFSQTEEQRKQIIKNYDLDKLHQLYLENSAFEKENKEKALKAAKLNGWPIIKKEKDGSFSELQGMINGTPLYYSIDNDRAAISTRANFLHNGGGLGLNVEGQGMTAYVWDGGAARTSHEDYSGRVTIGDGTSVALTSNNDHATHVTGTIVGLGMGNNGGDNSKGMAPQASAVSHDWSNDLTEATAAAANGMLLSNHSYGTPVGSIDDAQNWYIGAYTSTAQNWDELMYNAPYYLMVASAGNDGSDNSNTVPLEGNSAYDKLTGNKVAKNNLVIANGHDANVAANGSLIGNPFRVSGSSEGPADDLRIKPDIMGNGYQLYSASVYGNSNYNYKTGTSMSGPNVCGSLLLLQQHYNNINGSFMRAATLKGLAMHTADNSDIAGPDANTGWGLMNTKAAAEAITNNGLGSWISEETLSQGETKTFTVVSDGTNPLLASISWTDPTTGGYTNTTSTANEATAALVNDLDIRVEQTGTTFYPWKLTSVNSNTNANGTDNTVDPFERVDVNGASGTYTITVTHKGSLTTGKQKFSLIMTGLSSSIALVKKTDDQILCSNNDATFNFDYKQIGGGTSNITANNVPAGASVNFTQNSFSADGSFDVTFGNLSSVPAGEYVIGIIADNGNETETRNVTLTIYHNTFTNINQTIPANGSVNIATSPVINWDLDANSEEYLIEVATDVNFTNIINSGSSNTNSYNVNGLTSGGVYYWRVFGKNRCATASNANIFNFQVGTNCNEVVQTTDTTILDQNSVDSTLDVTQSITISDINVRVAYDHTWIGDVKLTLFAPNGNRVTLIDTNTCSDQTNFHIKFDNDATNDINCLIANNGGLTNYKPVGDLSNFYGLNSAGTWRLSIIDGGPGDTGTVTEWAIEFCDNSAPPTAPNFVNNGLNVDVNSTYTTVTGDIEASTTAETATQQTYTLIELPTIGNLRLNSTNLNLGDTFTQDDVNTGKVSYVNTETNPYVNQFKVNIENAASGWLPNQIVQINAANLNISDFEIGQLKIWPNPAKSNLFIEMNDAVNSDVNISLFDLQGRRVYQNSFNNNNSVFNQTIDLNNIANGSYIIQIEHDNKKATKQFIINN
ncbi:S8 family serine peptidase [Pseudofulvibacter geojedonensis]|uniref:S8 family serine peptidase n=1 Tax=Pseudofulvibacter geojedonensis TaxID=1123758 RepID=A0ABW3I0M0_9FLAO